jgi:hypothetical protein
VFFPADLWLRAFLLTFAVELPIVVSLLRGQAPDLVRLTLLVLFANLATHPLIWFVATQPLEYGTTEYTVVTEAWAVAAEAVFYWAAVAGVSGRRAFLASLLANAASFAVGVALGSLWPGVLS